MTNRECVICGKMYTPNRGCQVTCGGEECRKKRKSHTGHEWAERNPDRVREFQRRYDKNRQGDEKRLAKNRERQRLMKQDPKCGEYKNARARLQYKISKVTRNGQYWARRNKQKRLACKRWLEKNKKNPEWLKRWREKSVIRKREWAAKNRDKICAYNRNPEKRERENRKNRERWRSDPEYRLKKLLASRTKRELHANGPLRNNISGRQRDFLEAHPSLKPIRRRVLRLVAYAKRSHRVRERIRERRLDPEFKSREHDAQTKWRKNNHEKILERSKKAYQRKRNDPVLWARHLAWYKTDERRKKAAEYRRRRLREDPELKRRTLERAQSDEYKYAHRRWYYKNRERIINHQIQYRKSKTNSMRVLKMLGFTWQFNSKEIQDAINAIRREEVDSTRSGSQGYRAVRRVDNKKRRGNVRSSEAICQHSRSLSGVD